MTKATLSEAIKRGIVARIVSGKSTASKEAKAYGQKPATVRGWVHEKRNEVNKPPIETTPDTTPQGTTGPNKTVPSEGNLPSATTEAERAAAAERARIAGGFPSSGGGGAPGGGVVKQQATADLEALRIADEEDKKFVVDSYRDMKEGALDPVIARLGLPMDDPRVQRIVKPGVLTEQALKANAGWIAPKTREKMVGWLPLMFGLALDGVLTFFALRSLVGDVVKERMKDQPVKPVDKPAQ